MKVLDQFAGYSSGMVGVVIMVEDADTSCDVEVYLIGSEMKRIWFTINKARYDRLGLNYLMQELVRLHPESKAELTVDKGTMLHDEIMQIWRDRSVVNYKYKDMIREIFIW